MCQNTNVISQSEITCATINQVQNLPFLSYHSMLEEAYPQTKIPGPLELVCKSGEYKW